MLVASEFVNYLIKYVIFILIAVAGVLCGAAFKKKKLAASQTESGKAEQDV